MNSDLIDIEISCLELASGNYKNKKELEEELYRISNLARLLTQSEAHQ
tara:strand:+ start:404 stop:547 length:144 start_codon:yes stop_codon:yes gene_type:complete